MHFFKKRLLIVAAMVCLTGVAAAQDGRVLFANNAATRITNASGGGSPPFPRFIGNIGLYGSVALGLPDDTSLVPVGAPATTLAMFPGFFSAGSRNIGAGDDTVTLQVRAWTGNFPSYEAAYAAAVAGDETILFGKSSQWEQITARDAVAQPITGTGRLTPFLVYAIPEPSVISLAVIGLATMGWWYGRRSK